MPEAEAGGPRISRADWEGNQRADHWAKQALQDHPDQANRHKLLAECDVLAVGALKIGVAVYSQVVQDREARGALPPRRTRVPGGRGGSKPKIREWPWEVKGHRIQVLGEGHWRCDHCRKQAMTKTSLATLGKRPCHKGGALTPSERNARSQLAKWTKKAAAACGEVPHGIAPPTTHKPRKTLGGWECTGCDREARTLGGLGIFCGPALPAQAVRAGAQRAEGSRDIRSFFAPAGRPPGRPPDVEDILD